MRFFVKTSNPVYARAKELWLESLIPYSFSNPSVLNSPAGLGFGLGLGQKNVGKVSDLLWNYYQKSFRPKEEWFTRLNANIKEQKYKKIKKGQITFCGFSKDSENIKNCFVLVRGVFSKLKGGLIFLYSEIPGTLPSSLFGGKELPPEPAYMAPIAAFTDPISIELLLHISSLFTKALERGNTEHIKSWGKFRELHVFFSVPCNFGDVI